MPIIVRYRIERLTASRTEYYDGCETSRYDGWQDEATGADEFRTYAKAQRRADRVGGEVTRFQRFSHIADAFSAPVIQLVAAE